MKLRPLADRIVVQTIEENDRGHRLAGYGKAPERQGDCRGAGAYDKDPSALDVKGTWLFTPHANTRSRWMGKNT